MKSLSVKTAGRLVLIAFAALFVNNIASAQDWNGRRYITEDSGKCHDVIVQTITSDESFKSMPASERQTLQMFFSIAEMNMAIVFKSKNRYVSTAMFKINDKIAQAIGVGSAEMDNARQALAQISNDTKIIGTYSIENGILILISKDGTKETYKLLDKDGKRIQSELPDKLIYKQAK
ncbi:MAG: hypothetical protein IKS82_05635 [Bacteroidales bacterium]|nr:hypothetical protein [Bacteroidales bacterium]